MPDLFQGAQNRFPLKGRPAGEHLIEHGTQGVNVGGRAHFAVTAGGLLGRHVVRGADEVAAAGHVPGAGEVLGKAEVGDLGEEEFTTETQRAQRRHGRRDLFPVSSVLSVTLW